MMFVMSFVGLWGLMVVSRDESGVLAVLPKFPRSGGFGVRQFDGRCQQCQVAWCLIALRSFEFTRGMSRVRVRRHVKVETFQGAGFAKIMREMLGK